MSVKSHEMLAPTVPDLAQEGNQLSKAKEHLDKNVEGISTQELVGNIALAGTQLVPGEAPQSDSLGVGVEKSVYKDGYSVDVAVGSGIKAYFYDNYPNIGEGVFVPGAFQEGRSNLDAAEAKKFIIESHGDFMSGRIEERQLEVLDGISSQIAAKLHDKWRAPLEKKTLFGRSPKYVEDIEQTTDEAWIKVNGTNKVDIANTQFEELPKDWQKENKDAADVITGILVEMGTDLNLDDPDTRNTVGQKIHDAWLKRHQDDPTVVTDNLGLPFSELPEQEQQKDIQQLQVALELLNVGK